MHYKYILLILNCNKYRWKAEIQKNTWLPTTIKYFHVIGDPLKCGSEVYFIDNENSIIYVNTKDDYLSLPHKIISAIAAVHSTFTYDYIFKTDDDQMLINTAFFTNIESRLTNDVHYGGYTLDIDTHTSSYWEVHDVLPKNLILEGTTYATGRFYLLSRHAVTELLKSVVEIAGRMIEDHAIGYYLPANLKINMLRINTEVESSFIDYDKYINDNYFIFTECVNCPEICVNALISYLHFHPYYKVNVFMTVNDAKYILKYINHPNIIINYVDLSLSDVYNRDGHLGTAIIWANVIKMHGNKKIIHFDSDIIMRGDIVNDIICKLYNNDLVAPIRCYKDNENGRDDIRHLPDVASTYCFGFNPAKIGNYNNDILTSMVRGYHNPYGFPTLDFFDPVSFDILHNEGKIAFLDNNIIGGHSDKGGRCNKFKELNIYMDCGDKIIHFSSVGSGINFFKSMKQGKPINVSESYIKHSFKTLSTYLYLLFNIKTSNLPEYMLPLKSYFECLSDMKFIEIENIEQFI